MAYRQFLRKTSLLFLLATVFLKASWGVFSVTLPADLDTLTVGQLLQNRGEIKFEDSHDTNPYEALHEFFGGDPGDEDGYVDHREHIKSIRVISKNISAKFHTDDLERICKLKNLKEMIVCANLGETPACFQKLKKISSLKICYGNINIINPIIVTLVSLKHLNLSKSAIQELPDRVGDLKNMRSLDLSENNISKLPPSICELHLLKSLFLSKNAIKELPDRIGELTKLRSLKLRQNKIRTLPDSFRNLSALKSLDLSENPFAARKALGIFKNLLPSLPFTFKDLPHLGPMLEGLILDNRLDGI